MPNIFFTSENLVLSLPLLVVCASYAYFKYVPFVIGLPVLAAFALLVQVRSKLRARKVQKSLNEIDESLVKELSAEDDLKKAKFEAKALKKERKASEKMRQRIAAEKKAATTASAPPGTRTSQPVIEEEDMDDTLQTFAKGSRAKGKKK